MYVYQHVHYSSPLDCILCHMIHTLNDSLLICNYMNYTLTNVEQAFFMECIKNTKISAFDMKF